MIGPLQLKHVPWAVAQHAALMQQSVFAMFGPRFLELWYRAFAISPHAVAFVDEQDGHPRAVIASTSNRPAFLRELLRRSGFALAWCSARAVLRNGACRRLVGRLPGYLARSGRGDVTAEMIFITVAPAVRGHGIAQQLIRRTLQEFRRRGVDKVHVSIESGKHGVRAMLHSFGFVVIDRFAFADKPHELLALDLTRRAVLPDNPAPA